MLHDIIDQIFLNRHRHDSPPSPPHVPASTMAADQNQPATCPVDHKSREAWLDKAKAATAAASDPPATSLPPSHPPIPTNTSSSASAESCPVDHGAREVWMQQARAASGAPAHPPSGIQPRNNLLCTPTSSPASASWSSYLPRIPFFSSSPDSKPKLSTPQPAPAASHLGKDREVSTIPRTSVLAGGSSGGGDHAPTRQPPANNEQETGADGVTGNWIYPSERMFFDAMKRKGHDPRAADMRTVVPIHNAVNERAWAEIKAWEEPWGSCNPRLHSFSGLSTRWSPRALFNTLLGYQAPFDRHDWVVDRCGRKIEYVIDFYAGRPSGGSVADGKLSFYLDVRPKLNSWEGIKMRVFKNAGIT